MAFREPRGLEDLDFGPNDRDLSRSKAGGQAMYPTSAATMDDRRALDLDPALPGRVGRL